MPLGRPEVSHADGRHGLGVVLRRLGHREEAIREFRTAIRLQPDLGEAYCGLALALLLDSPSGPRANGGALGLARRAVNLTKSASTYIGLAMAEYRAGHPAERWLRSSGRWR